MNFADFEGRATRKEFWWFVLFFYLVIFFSGAISQLLFLEQIQYFPILRGAIGILLLSFFTVLFFAIFAVKFRRLNDAGFSAWWLLIGIIPIIGLVILIFIFCVPSKALSIQSEM